MSGKYGLYIHIPFCAKKCKYCDFASYAGRTDAADEYINAVLKEAERYRYAAADTVFIGGGTPTALNSEQLVRLIRGIKDIFNVDSGAEFTVEANPGTITGEKCSALKGEGVNRISIGVQSFSDSELKLLGRIHTAAEAVSAVKLAKKYFDSVNADIMTGLPGQTEASVMSTLNVLKELNPEHISCYSLIYEEGTELFKMLGRGEINPISGEQDRSIYHAAKSFLEKCGYEQYEISNFAKSGHRCRHNIKYWTAREYIGLGVSAHSFVGNKRYFNTSSLDEYLLGKGLFNLSEELSVRDAASEYAFMSLRMTDGIDTEEFKNRFGLDFDEIYGAVSERFVSAGLMKKTGRGYALTDRGADVANAVMCEYV